MLFECLKQDASQRIILIVQTNPSKGVQENILKAWNFTTYKLHHRYFDNNLQKNFRTNILESDTAVTFDSCFNCRILFISPKLENDSIFTYCQRNISAWLLKAVLYSPAEAISGSSQPSQMELFARIVLN